MPNSPNKGYTQPAYNSEVGTWGTDLNNNFSGIVDNNLGGTTSVSLSNANVTLTSTQAQNLTIFLTGTLLTNVTVSTPCIGFFFVVNNTTGSYSVTIQANFGGGGVGSSIVIPRSTRQFLVSDASNGLQYGAAPSTLYLPGEVKSYAGSSAPTGWLLCYGQAVSRSLYASLYSVIGTTYGVGDGSTTFNVPDLRGRTIFGLDNMGGSSAGRLTGTPSGSISTPTALGNAGGEEGHALTSGENGPHTHTITDPGHTHTYKTSTVDSFYATGGGSVMAGPATTNTGSHTTGITINSAGSGTSHNNVPPAMVLNFIIKI